MRVLVIGAGLGGLCLAHGLRADGFDVTVLERSETADAQPASYGIHLNADGLAALHSCLPEENWRQLVEGAVPALDIVRFRDERLRVLAQRDHEDAQINLDPVTRRRAVRRDALHTALVSGLDGTVKWGRRFESYRQLEDGRVRVRCADGSEYEADLVVGADGSNSPVRAQRLPGLERRELGILNIAARVWLTPELRTLVPETLVDGSINNIVPSKPGWMFVSTWAAGVAADAATFAVWAWAADRSSYPDDVDRLAPEQLRDLVADRVASWSPAVAALVAAADPTSVSTVPLRTMPPLPEWTPQRVTLLGDAIHNMTPMAGIGANTALRDAAELRRALRGDGELLEQVGRYETAMRGYANQALALSARNARNAASPARLPRTGFRTALRIAGAVPSVRRMMFGAPPPLTMSTHAMSREGL